MSPPMSDMTPLAHALSHAARGWPVFPLAPGSKIPLISKENGGNGFHDATLDIAQITEWWSEWPEANIGIATEEAGLVVIDLDVREGLALGERSWCDLLVACGTFEPPTYEVTTPSGGTHLYFRAPEGVKVLSRAGVLGNGIDTKGARGQIVAAGSKRHGGEYARATDSEPVAVPEWLLGRLSDRGLIEDETRSQRAAPSFIDHPSHGTNYAHAALTGQAADVRAAPAGQRNYALNVAAFRMRHLVSELAISWERVADELLAAALDSGLNEREARRTIASGLNQSGRGIA